MIRDNYQGYLRPYLPRIKELYANGVPPNKIAEILYDEGARSDQLHDEWETIRTLSGLTRHILGLRKVKPNLAKIQKRVERATQELEAAKNALAEARATVEVAKKVLAKARAAERVA